MLERPHGEQSDSRMNAAITRDQKRLPTRDTQPTRDAQGFEASEPRGGNHPATGHGEAGDACAVLGAEDRPWNRS